MKSIIGIDCSTNPKKLGLCRSTVGTQGLVVEEVVVGASHPTDLIGSWVKDSSALIALDAPLGWPTDQGKSLRSHLAGQAIPIEGNQLFRRATDRFVKNKLGKQSLDVGADRIARTALWAVNFKDALSQIIGETIPLVWSADFVDPIAAIEVYPAASLISRNLALQGYKQKENIEVREEILAGLESEVEINCNRQDIVTTDDALDSVVCVVAGYDFLNDRCYEPVDMELAKKEGWIWVAGK
jgi:hypothetical protein